MRRFLQAAGLALVLCATPAFAQDEGLPEDLELDDLLEGVDAVEGAIEEVEVDDALASGGEVTDDVDPADLADSLELERATQAALRGTRRDTVSQRVGQLLHDPLPRRRASAVRAVGSSGQSLGLTPVIVALRDRSPEVRRAAADALAKLGGFEALGALRQALPRERNPQATRALDKAIGAVEDRVFAGPDGGAPVTLVCHSCGRKFCLLRKTRQGYCPYDGVPWTLGLAGTAKGSSTR